MSLSAKNTHGVIRFSLKESVKKLEATPKKESLIVMHFSSRGRRFKKSIGYKCSLSQWDLSRQRVKTNKNMMSNAYEVNKYIDDIRAFTEKTISSMKIKGILDLDRLSHLIDCKINSCEVDEEQNQNSKIIAYCKNLLELKKNTIGVTTYRSYKQTLRLLQLYEKVHKEVLKFDEVNLSFYRKFVTLLEDENYSLNSIGKHVKNLKLFLNDALINGITNNTIFKNKSFKVLKETTTDVYLTQGEIKTLAEKDFSNRPRIELARDIFLIGCYTGQRVSDYNGLTNENIEILDGHKFIKIRQKKTDTIVLAPITKEIESVMQRYGNNFPPKLSEPILRKNIKTACSSVGFKDMISVFYTKGGKSVKKQVPKYSLIKTHTARRSFCTNLYVAGKNIQHIMLFSGHKTEREFYKYIRIEREQKALEVLKSGFFD